MDGAAPIDKSEVPGDPPGKDRPEEKSQATPSPGPSTAALNSEEQMALYEKDLKENDWGHQPC